MISLVRLAVVGDNALQLVFSNDAVALWSAADLIERDTVMMRPLAVPAYFARAFSEGGALAWPNGLELSAHRLSSALGFS
jgi:hypothetical protein